MRWLLLTFILIEHLCYAQLNDSITIIGQIKNNTRYAYVVMWGHNAKGNYVVDKTPINNEYFKFSFARKELNPGIYRFEYSQNDVEKHIDIIIGNETNIQFSIDANFTKPFPIFTQSNENLIFYNYQAFEKKQMRKVITLENLIYQYPSPDDDIIKSAYSALKKEQNILLETQKTLSKKHNGMLLGKVIQNRPLWFANPKDHPRLKHFYYQEHFWDKLDTRDTSLLFTPIYQEAILGYLKYYLNPDTLMSKQEELTGYKNAIDTIIKHFSSTTKLKKFAIDYLNTGFKEMGKEDIIQYIDEHYQSVEQCENDKDKSEFNRRMEGYKTLKPGMPAPNIQLLRESSNVPYSLDNITEPEYIIIAFWASWCPHCMETMPLLNQKIGQQKRVEVVAISLDDDVQGYVKAKNTLPNMQHYCDFKKWESTPAKNYYVVATPSFLLLDKYHRIVSKHSSLDETLLKIIEGK